MDMYAETFDSVEPHKICTWAGLPVTLPTVEWDRGIDWTKALKLREEHLAHLRDLRRHERARERERAGLAGGTMDEGGEEEEEEEAYYDGCGTGFYKYTGGDSAAAQRLENIMLALELPEVSSLRRLKKGSNGYRAVKRYRLVYPNSGLVREGEVERSDGEGGREMLALTQET